MSTTPISPLRISDEFEHRHDVNVAVRRAAAVEAAVGSIQAYWTVKKQSHPQPLLRRLRPPPDYDDPDYTVMFRPQWYNRQRKLPSRAGSVRTRDEGARSLYKELTVAEMARQQRAEDKVRWTSSHHNIFH